MSTTKKVLTGCAIAAGVALLLIVVGTILVAAFVLPKLTSSSGPPQMPAQLSQARVLAGQGALAKKEFLRDARLGSVTDIASGKLDPDVVVALGFASGSGVLYTDDQGKPVNWVGLPGRGGHVDFVDVERDGVAEYLERGSWGSKAALMSHDGKTLWTYGGMPGVDDMGAGDVDGDGYLEFAVGFNGGGGVHLLDRGGRRRWKEPDGNVWHVEVFDTDGDGKAEVVHSNAGGQMTIRDAGGKVIRRVRPPAYFAHFSLCPWPSPGGAPHPLYAEDDTVWVLAFDGTAAAKFAAPGSGSLGAARGALVRLSDGKPERLAVAVSYRNWKRSILYLFDTTGKLLYQEVLAGPCESIAALPRPDGTEALLVGGEGVVWQYTTPAAKGL